MASQPDHSASLDSRVDELQAWALYPEWATSYAAALHAIARIVDPPGGRTLLSATLALCDLDHHVPWLRPALTPTYPALRDLTALYQATDQYTEGLPRKGYAQHRLLMALRRPGGASPHDRALRSLAVVLAARAQNPEAPNEQVDAVARCIDVMATALGGLYDSRNLHGIETDSPLLRLLARCSDAQSLQTYVNRLRAELSTEPNAHTQLERRVRLDIDIALGEAVAAPCPPEPSGGGRVRRYELPADEGDPDPPLTRLLLDSVDTAIDPEPEDESKPVMIAAEVAGTTGKQTSLHDLIDAARVAARPQKIVHQNNLLLDLHVDVLTEQEARLLAPGITNAGIAAAQSGNDDRAIQLAIAALSLATGYETQRAAALLAASPNNTRPYLSADRAYVISPTLPLSNAYSPTPKQQKLLTATVSRIRIPLPPPLTGFLTTLPWARINWARVHPLHTNIGRAIGDVCADLKLYAVTKGRVRRTCSAHLFATSQDLPAVMHLTRDTFGSSLAPMYYCCFEESYLQKIYRGAIWPFWGCQADEELTHSTNRYVGSRGLVLEEHARRIAHSIGAAFQRGIPAKPVLNELVVLHNTLMMHVTAMLMAVVGHRPVNKLFSLTTHAFDLNHHAAIFADKEVDAAHRTRLVALGSLVSEQLRAYIQNLVAAGANALLPQTARKAMNAAVTGRHPLFFALNDEGLPEELTIQDWKTRAPGPWQNIPTNWGRHFLASQGRRLEINPVHLHIQLGHLESAGYPYSLDSPMDPLGFLEKMGTALDDIFRRQGWSCRRVQRSGRWEDDWKSLRPLRRWTRDMRQQQKRALADRRLLRQQYRVKQHATRNRAEDLAIEAAGKQNQKLASLIQARVLELRHKRAPVASEYTAPNPDPQTSQVEYPKQVFASTKEIVGILDALEEACQSDPALAIAAHNTMARCLRWGARQRRYYGFVPGFRILRSPADPSPFLPAHMQATRQIHWLRQHCRNHLKDGNFSSQTPDHRLGTLLLAVIVYGGIDSQAALDILCSGDSHKVAIPALSDAVVVCSADGGQVGLLQTAALCYARLHHDYLSTESLNVEDLENALSGVIPGQAQGTKGVLDALLETMQVAHRIERSGLANFALDRDSGCVPLSLDRFLELLGHPPKPADSPPDVVIEPAKLKQKTYASQEYEQIKRCWPNKQSDIELPLTGEIIELKKRNDTASKRRVYSELQALAQTDSWSLLGSTLASWLAWELINRQPNGDEFRKYGGVYSEFTEVSSRLVDRANDFPMDFDSSDLEETYLDVVLSAADTNGRRIFRGVRSYHEHLTLHHAADPINFIEIRLAAGVMFDKEEVIDNQMMLPHEQQSAVSIFERSAKSDETTGTQTPQDLRLLRQIILIYELLISTGARVNEILGLRRRDVILLPDQIYLIIRDTGYLDVKTTSARRLIDLNQWLAAPSLQALRDWIAAEEAMGLLKEGANLIFADLANQPVKPYIIRKTLSACYGLVSFWRIKNHHSRHTAKSDLHCRREIHIGLDALNLPQEPALPEKDLQLPWDLQRDTRQFGHALPRTGLRHYTHIPCVFSLRAQRNQTNTADRRILAACLGISPSAADNRLQRHGDQAVGQAIRAIDTLLEPPVLPGTRLKAATVTLARCTDRLSQYLLACSRRVPPDQAGTALGVRAAEQAALRSACAVLTDHTDLEVIPNVGRTSMAGRARPRWYGASRQLIEICSTVETLGPGCHQWIQIVNHWYAHRRRSDHGLIRLPVPAAEQLRQLLSRWGYQVTYDERADTLIEVSVQHASTGRHLQYILAYVFALTWVVHQAPQFRATAVFEPPASE